MWKKITQGFYLLFKFLKRKVFVILNACGPFLRYYALFGVSWGMASEDRVGSQGWAFRVVRP